MNATDKLRASRFKRYEKEEREALEHEGDWGKVKRLMRYLRPRRKPIAIAIVMSVVTALLVPVPMIIAQYTIDTYIMQGDLGGVFLMAGVLLSASLLLFGMEAAGHYLIAKIGQDSMKDLRMDVFDHIQSQSPRFFDRNPVGRLITRITSDVNVLNELFAQGVVGIFQQVFSLVVILGVLFYYNWYLTLWFLPVTILVFLAAWNFRNNVSISYRLTRVRLSRLNSFMQENLTGMRTVQANNREKSQFSHFDELNDSHREAHLQTVFQYALFFPIVELLTTFALALVLYIGGKQFINGTAAVGMAGAAVTVGQLALFIQALERFFQPVRDLSEKYNLIQAAVAAGERLFLLLDTKPLINDPEDPVEPTPLSVGIEFRDVWFAYNDEEWVLKGVSFKIEKGQTVAIVGPTGSGKTTLMSLLCRFYDVQKGAILIDGVDIRQFRQRDLRKKLAIVLQDVFLFYGTVAENIRLGSTEIDDERIELVSRETGSHEFIKKLPANYDSGVKERGATLSVGQKQLLSFARALAFDPEILVLDEATSNIDTESEEKLKSAVAALCAGRTALVIAHRLSTIQRADKIIVIHHGSLVEEGTHQELLTKDGLYRRLYELQYKEELAS